MIWLRSGWSGEPPGEDAERANFERFESTVIVRRIRYVINGRVKGTKLALGLVFWTDSLGMEVAETSRTKKLRYFELSMDRPISFLGRRKKVVGKAVGVLLFASCRFSVLLFLLDEMNGGKIGYLKQIQIKAEHRFEKIAPKVEIRSK